MLEVHDLDNSISISTLKKGLKANSFYFFLSKKFPYDFFELFSQTDNYIIGEERMVEKQREKLD